MATDLEKLVVQLSADIKGYEREMRKATGVTNTQARAIERRYTEMGQNLDRIGSSAAQALIAPIAGILAGASAREVIRYAETWTNAGNQIKAAAQIAGTAARPLEGINDIAISTRGGFEETATLYARILRSTAGVAKSEQEVATATEIVNKAFKAGGASASEMAAGVLQLSQGLQSGVLAGDELRSVRENAPLLAQAIADYFKTTVGGLKDLGAEGKLTAEEVFKAILFAGPKIDAAFKVTNATIGDGITKVNNALTQYIGQADSSYSGTQRLVAGLNLLADNFDTIADATVKVAAVIAGALVGRSIVGMISKLGVATTAVTTFIGALRAAGSIGAALSAIGGLSAVAGPLGLIIGGTVVGALALFGTQTKDATASAKAYAEALKLVENSARASGDAAAGAGKKYVEAQRNTLKGGVGFGETNVADLRKEIDGLLQQYDLLSVRRVIAPEQLAQIDEIIKAFRNGSATVEDTRDALFKLANSNPNFQALAERIGPLLEQLNNATKATSLLKAELGKLGETSPSFRQGEEKTMATYEALKKASDAYLADAEKRNKLTKDQLAIENEIAKIKKDTQSKGIFLGEDQIKKLAAQNVAADTRRGEEGKPVKKTGDDRINAELQQISDRTAALDLERQTLGLSTEAQERQRISLELQQGALASLREEARRKGETDLESIQLSDEQKAKIDEVAAAYGRAAAALERANGPLGSYAREAANVDRQLEEAAVGGLKSFEDAILSVVDGSATAAEAFRNMANSIIADLIRIAIRKSITGPLASGLGGLLGFSEGGPVPSFASGGFTGFGGKYQPAGIVHGGEYVFSKRAVDRVGVGTLDAMHKRAKGYAEGGLVMPSVRSPSRGGSGSAAGGVLTVRVSMDNELLRAVVTDESGRVVAQAAPEIIGAAVMQSGESLRNSIRNDADTLTRV